MPPPSRASVIQKNIEMILAQETHTSFSLPDANETHSEIMDFASHAQYTELEAARLDVETANARTLERIRQRIREGLYGVCVECERKIATPRLHVLPMAERCIRCEELLQS